MNTEMHVDILHLRRDAVGRERSENWRIKSWFPLYDNAPAHRSVWVNDFLAKNNVTTLDHSPHLAAAEFKMFPD